MFINKYQNNREKMTSINNKDKALDVVYGESPAEYAERLGIYYTSIVVEDHKKKNGQFFTPLKVAKFMSSFSQLKDVNKKKIRILDPGCGIGILSAALCEEIYFNSNIKSVELIAFETDLGILPFADLCYNYMAKWLRQKDINFTFFLCKNDFILHNSNILLNNKKGEYYDFIISNPPYFKLQKKDERVVATKDLIYGQSNIYSIFLLIAAKLLSRNGQLIFITPRSFCSGSYFRLFRELFFKAVDLQEIHLFNSRRDTFKRDKVLQENIIISAKIKINSFENRKKVYISSSKGIDDIALKRIKEYSWPNLINLKSYQKILHLPSSSIDEKVIEIFKTWTGSLHSYQLEISTGPVVDFRSLEYIKDRESVDTVPLFWLHNVENMKIIWPKYDGYKGKYKGQHIIKNEKSLKRLIQKKNYVLIRRFSTKEDNKRLIAAPYIKVDVENQNFIGVENHLNYIYHTKKEMSDELTYGLAAILNSRLFDIYFRTFNGNINVSATELRDFPLPKIEKIQLLGKIVLENEKLKEKYEIDKLVAQIFNLSDNLFKNYE